MGSPVDVKVWREHWQDEGDAAYLYQSLAAIEPDQTRAEIYRRLAEVEERHVKLCGDILKEQGETLPPFRPSLRARGRPLILHGPRHLPQRHRHVPGRARRRHRRLFHRLAPHRPSLTGIGLPRVSRDMIHLALRRSKIRRRSSA